MVDFFNYLVLRLFGAAVDIYLYGHLFIDLVPDDGGDIDIEVLRFLP